MTGDSGFALPSASSWQSVDSMNEHPMAMGTAASPPASSGLVDRDFRGRFVETQKKLASSTNLAALGRIKKTGSVVRFADEIPHDLRKGKEKEIPPDDSAGPSRLKSSLSSRVHANDDDSHTENVGLPRTKSQLSLLIKQERDATGSHELGPGAGPTNRNVKSKGKEKENTRSNEQELLSMGQQGGVTKAGGVQVPEQQRLSEHHDPRYESSSSPEPLF
ncbi:hypothetical protein HRR77_004945 [Exophiala dermatitidis]|nr:hypothetical protein HRR77_004945 [Exophiala dermatitidis]